MNKYILVAFAVMGVGFYELSGGADFEPGPNSVVVFAVPDPAEPQPIEVARANIQPTELTGLAAAPAAEDGTEGLSGVSLTTATLAPSDSAAPAEDVQVAAVVSEAVEQDPVPEPNAAPDLRFVDGDRVNMRGGPGTEFAVVGRLLRNDMVEVIKDDGNGWLHLRVTATGEEGWMADWLVSASN
ncbi:SH3 domain-containing protein [Marivita sp. S0852]|uniref:SH3 domain-containing protein n=1 Tax=Marivita sp. S0852 TaxID=3373893 RepID=UPI00398297E8